MLLPIIEAGKFLGVHRATLHRWLKAGLITKDEKTGLVETDSVIKQMGKRKRGRPVGGAYTKARLSKVGDYGVTLERAIVLLSGILKTLSPAQQTWVKETILARIDDPKLLSLVEQSIPASQEAVVETKSQQVWRIAFEETVKPKVNVHSPIIQQLGEELKRRELEEEAGFPARPFPSEVPPPGQEEKQTPK